ncbi:GLPGLI family protein [uncultured Dokdonia sp.]|uniref:GLPGLI family protein n=1 Tax=uncultured Dokdonia sp. TaxID=575653 RepID=UPI0026201FBF|nr:GLPGLI family protein [uncultured Dokdonia sp.]
MKSITKTLLALVMVCAFAKAYSQQVSGVATYQTQRHIEMKMDSTSGITSDIQKTLQEQLRKQFQKEYTLTFDGKKSLWKENATLDKPQAPSSSGIQIQVSTSNDELFNNIEEQSFTNKTNLMGKDFLIEDSLKKPEWKLEKEIKNIGQYTCFKATLTEEKETINMVNGEETAPTKETKVTTAWYTLDIPVQQGPDRFWGLPGLILEVNDGQMAMMCTKVVLNPSEKLNIIPPTKGKKVSADEYEEISTAKAKEMMERYQTKGKKGGNHISIEIQG